MTEAYQISNPQITSEAIDGEVIIINLENENYYSMSGVGTLIWECLKGNLTKHKIIEKIQKPAFTPPVLNKYSDMKDLLLLDPIHDVDEGGWPISNVKI